MGNTMGNNIQEHTVCSRTGAWIFYPSPAEKALKATKLLAKATYAVLESIRTQQTPPDWAVEAIKQGGE